MTQELNKTTSIYSTQLKQLFKHLRAEIYEKSHQLTNLEDELHTLDLEADRIMNILRAIDPKDDFILNIGENFDYEEPNYLTSTN